MKKRLFTKREMLKAGAVLPIAGLFAPSVRAQDGRLFGIPLPKEIADILPRKPLNYLRAADTVLRLEREADAKKLPESLLQLNKGAAINPSSDNSLYELALPRLVALIDRAESIDPTLADQAGGLLAELHQQQWAIPEFLAAFSGNGSPVMQLDGQQSASPLQLPDGPIVSSPVEPVTAPETAPPVAEPVPAPTPAPPSSSAPPPESETENAPEPFDIKELSRARDFASLRGEYRKMWDALSLRPEKQESANWHASMARQSRSRYQRVERDTGVPWYFIAVTHGLEASFNFRAHLHNGDFPLTTRTRQVPAGRPSIWLPPSDWESSARDALRLLGFTGQKDWSLERTLYRLEAYNGLGYRRLGVPTPYLWSFSNHYARGKFVADGKFSATARSQQCGAAVILKLLADSKDIDLT